jgi:hypothetical protein
MFTLEQLHKSIREFESDTRIRIDGAVLSQSAFQQLRAAVPTQYPLDYNAGDHVVGVHRATDWEHQQLCEVRFVTRQDNGYRKPPTVTVVGLAFLVAQLGHPCDFDAAKPIAWGVNA